MRNGNPLSFKLITRDGGTTRDMTVSQAIIAGWTARDVAAMEKHIRELEEIGVPRPTATPMYYRVGATRLTTAPAIQAAGGDSSGEAEFVMVNIDGDLWIGAGSDHTDRKVETYNITVSKQMCDKPVAPVLWPWRELADHWDTLTLRSHAVIDGKRVLYQEGKVAAMRPPTELIDRYNRNHGRFEPGSLMFGGTLGAIGGIRPASRFEFELVDDKLGRSIAHGYDIETLPIVG